MKFATVVCTTVAKTVSVVVVVEAEEEEEKEGEEEEGEEEKEEEEEMGVDDGELFLNNGLVTRTAIARMALPKSLTARC